MIETPMNKAGRIILLGRIIGAHGIRGEVVIASYTGEPGAIADYGQLLESGGARRFRLTGVRVSARGVVARIDGVNDRNAAEALKGVGLAVMRDRLPAPAPGEFYHEDLVGLAVHDPAGEPIGTVAGVQNYGAGDLIEIRFAATGQSELVPFTMACVPAIDIARRRVVVCLPDMVAGEAEGEAGERETEGGNG